MRTIVPSTPSDNARIDELARLAEGERADVIARWKMREAEASRPTFLGQVLRAINPATVRVDELASLAGVSPVEFDEFRCGLRPLPIEAFERVARRLGFELVRRDTGTP